MLPVGGSLPDRVKRAAIIAGQVQGIRSPSTARSDMQSGAAVARLRSPLRAARSGAILVRMLRQRPIDVCIQNGSEFVLPRKVRFVTFEDSTVVQAREAYPWPHLEGMTTRDFDALVRCQRRLYERAVACCTLSQWAADSIVADYGIDPGRVHVVGVGPNHASSPPSAREWWPPRFLFVGVDWHRKNGDRVLEAFDAVRRHHPAATLDVVGRHPEINCDNVTGHGFLSLAVPEERERLSALFARATALLAPSLHDPSPVVHVEAGSVGIGSIGTRNGGAATVIGDGGFLVEPLDVEAMTRAMLSMCDADTARQTGKRAQTRAAQLTWRKVAERLVRAARLPDVDVKGLAEFL